jgi:hypothetical protein
LYRFRSIVALAILLILPAVAEAQREVDVLVESRKGIGLIPSFWRGVIYGGGTFPEFDVNWVRVDPQLVVTAWREKIGGGGPGWVALDAAINAAAARHARILLPLPTKAAPLNVARWEARVEDTVRRTHSRVDRFEILGDTTAVTAERYLALYETGVWAAYRGDEKAAIGGPGVDWQSSLPTELIHLCAKGNLPLHFVSWQILAETGNEPEVSYRKVERVLDRVGLSDRPAAIVTRWEMGEPPDAAAVTLSFLKSLTKAIVDAGFADLEQLPWGEAAMRVFDRLGQVEIPVILDSDSGLNGVATLEGDDVRMLFWASRPTRAKLSVSGMRWGRTYDYTRSVVGLTRTQVVESRDLRAEDPVEISLSLTAGSPVFLTLTPKQ